MTYHDGIEEWDVAPPNPEYQGGIPWNRETTTVVDLEIHLFCLIDMELLSWNDSQYLCPEEREAVQVFTKALLKLYFPEEDEDEI